MHVLKIYVHTGKGGGLKMKWHFITSNQSCNSENTWEIPSLLFSVLKNVNATFWSKSVSRLRRERRLPFWCWVTATTNWTSQQLLLIAMFCKPWAVPHIFRIGISENEWWVVGNCTISEKTLCFCNSSFHDHHRPKACSIRNTLKFLLQQTRSKTCYYVLNDDSTCTSSTHPEAGQDDDVQQVQQQHSTSEQPTQSSSHATAVTLHIAEGKTPVSLLFDTSKVSNCDNPDKVPGMLPVNLL